MGKLRFYPTFQKVELHNSTFFQLTSSNSRKAIALMYAVGGEGAKILMNHSF